MVKLDYNGVVKLSVIYTQKLDRVVGFTDELADEHTRSYWDIGDFCIEDSPEGEAKLFSLAAERVCLNDGSSTRIYTKIGDVVRYDTEYIVRTLEYHLINK